MRPIRALSAVLVGTVLSSCGTQSPAVSESAPPGPSSSTRSPDSATASPEVIRLADEGQRFAELEYVGDLYDVPDPLPAAERGTLIRLQPIDPNIGDRAYRMLYHSLAVADESDIGVSGTLWLPSGPPPEGGYPIVSFGPGTYDHFSDVCPYSNFDAWNPEEYWGLLDDILDAGYVVAYSDYQGLGTRHPYAYAVGESMTRAMLDAARAARDLLGRDASTDVLLVGHSVGAEGVMAALNFGPEYDDGLDVRGVAALDGYIDHRTAVERAMSGDNPASIRFGVLGYTRAYPELDAGDIYTDRVIDSLAFFDETGCNVEQPVVEGTAEELVRASPLDVEAWVDRIDAAIPHEAPYPVFYAVADLDPDAAIREAGGDEAGVEVRHYPNSDHFSVIIDASRDLIEWIATVRS
jgi:secretory lipase